jgi:hypothetical protein
VFPEKKKIKKCEKHVQIQIQFYCIINDLISLIEISN